MFDWILNTPLKAVMLSIFKRHKNMKKWITKKHDLFNIK